MNQRIFLLLEYDKILHKVSEYCLSGPGADKISALTPHTDFEEVRRSLDETDEALVLVAIKPHLPVSSFSDITLQLKRLNAFSVLNAGELLKILSLLKAAKCSHQGISDNDNTPFLYSMAKRLYYSDELIHMLDMSIISETEISDNASPALYSIRRKILREHDSIREKLNSMIKNSATQKYLQENIITQRSGRYVVPVKQEYKSSVPGLIHDQSGSGQTLFIEPMSVVESNNKLRVLMSEEQTEIERILAKLSASLAPYTSELNTNLVILTHLDAVFAKALYTRKIKGVMPKLNQDGITYIKNGRHPLIDSKQVVPVTVAVGENYKGLVITGPNTGGKTVSLKLTGLLQLMAQSGIFVPAETGTSMTVYKKIYADIGDEQSIEQSLSTFSSHMKNIIDIISNADEHSLVLLDELGAGTDPAEGAALAIAIIEELKYRQVTFMATTHYSEIKAYALTDSYLENAGMEFNTDTLSPTYKMFMGIPGLSNAFLIAGRLGLPSDIIGRAKNHISEEHIRFEQVLGLAEKERSTQEALRQSLDEKYAEIDKLNRLAEEKLEHAKEKSGKILADAQEKASLLLQDTKNEIEEIIDELKAGKQTAQDDRTITQVASKSREKFKFLSQKHQKYTAPRKKSSSPVDPKTLNLGSEVYVVSASVSGSVYSLPDSKGMLEVQAGIIKLKVHISELENIKKKREYSPRSSVSLDKTPVRISLDLRGKNIEEACVEIDDYIDRCVLSGLSEVTIIHGHGTGMLKKGVRAHLRTIAAIKSFRAGHYGEGEDGVTIVEI